MPNQVISGKPNNLEEIYIYGINLAQRTLLRDSARDIVQCFRDPVIVNIGVAFGGSMHCLRLGAPEAKLIGIDVHYHRKVGLSPLGAEFMKGNSNQIHEQVPPPIHLLFIDGGHDCQTVKGDIEGWIPKVVPGGIVIFHDVELPGVSQAMREWDSSKWTKEIYVPGCFSWTSGMEVWRRD